jgi:hypothetical protein
MRNLLNFIFANLVPILVVVSIVLRIIGGMKSQARKKQLSQTLQDDPAGEQEPEEKEEYADVWSRLRPDEEEARPSPVYGRGSGGVRGDIHLPAQEIRPLLMPVPATVPPRPRAVPPPLSPVLPFKPEPPLFEPESEPTSEVMEVTIETKRETPGGNSAAAFFRRIENLSPLRRAVILAEILGSPRGLSNFPVE